MQLFKREGWWKYFPSTWASTKIFLKANCINITWFIFLCFITLINCCYSSAKLCCLQILFLLYLYIKFSSFQADKLFQHRDNLFSTFVCKAIKTNMVQTAFLVNANKNEVCGKCNQKHFQINVFYILRLAKFLPNWISFSKCVTSRDWLSSKFAGYGCNLRCLWFGRVLAATNSQLRAYNSKNQSFKLETYP